MPSIRASAPLRSTLVVAASLALPGCATLGSLMSPYSETFSCRNDDHGQCIHPERAHADAVAGATSASDRAVTNDRSLLRGRRIAAVPGRRGTAEPDAFASYRTSVYRELKGLLEAPVTPMLKPARTVRTLVLPYADRQRPDRLYMPRYIYSILDKPVWVVGGTLVSAPSRAAQLPVLGQVQEPSAENAEAPGGPGMEPQP